jgi:hypothetical protein
MRSDCDLTVVVACVDAARSIERCLSALQEACAGIRAQVVVVDASRDATARLVQERWPTIELLRFPPGTVVPRLWAAGVHVARGRAVAFTIGHLVVAPTWAHALVRGLQEAAAVGGPLVLADQTHIVDWAVFYLRYSAVLPSQLPDGPVDREIAGDNAAYARAALARHASTLTNGFWETEFHRHLRREGGRLSAASQATAAFCASSPFWCIARHRYAHGRYFGASRVVEGSSTLRIVSAAPLVPLVLAWRAARRVLPDREHQRRFLLALPLFLVFATMWAFGEAHGALTGPPRIRPTAASSPA